MNTFLRKMAPFKFTKQISAQKLNPVLTWKLHKHNEITPIEELITRFYARILTRDEPSVVGKLGTCFGKYRVSLKSVVQTGFQDKLAEIVVVTHDVQEGDFRKALEEIESLDTIHSTPSIFRVL